MAKYVVKRIMLALVTAFIILSLTYILVAALPPALTIGPENTMYAFFEDQVSLGFVVSSANPITDGSVGEELWHFVDSTNRTHYYYKMLPIKQYFYWLRNIVTEWNWGVSTQIRFNYSAIGIMAERLPVSILLNVISVVVSVPLGILLGIWAGLKKNKTTDHVISTLVMVFISIPSFVIISFLIYFLGFKTNLLPTQWPTAEAPDKTKFLAFIIPVVSLSFGSICGYCRFVRAELCEVLSSEYLLLARTKGLTKNQAIIRHALRNAFVPILPSILAEFIGVLGGSMILEQLYNIPGIGSLYITALNMKDYPVLMVDMAVFTTISLLAGIILDLSYGFIDPRIRMGAKK